MKRPALLVLLVVLLVAAVLVVKQAGKSQDASRVGSIPEDHPVREIAAAAADSDFSREHAATASSDESDDAAQASETVDVSPDEAPDSQAEARPAPSSEDAETEQPAGETPQSADEQAPAPSPEAPPEPIEPLPASKFEEARSNGRPTMVDFSAEWCAPCRMMEPVIEEVTERYHGTVDVVLVDVDGNQDLARQYGIRAIPTQIFFDADGEEASRHTGYCTADHVAGELAKLGVKE